MFLIEILSLIGTSAFAISGALSGIKKKLDIFGIIVLAIITSSGGGLLRDIIIGRNMPVLFVEPKYIIISIISALIVCVALPYITRIKLFILIFDAVGLGIFTIYTAQVAIECGIPFIGTIFVSVLAGTGGGIIRDVLLCEVPLILRSEIYAVAAIAGCILFKILYNIIELNINFYISTSLIFIIRMISLHFKFNLPVIKSNNDDK